MARLEAVFTDLLNRGGGRLDFRRFVESSLRSSPGGGGGSAGSFPEQRLVIEPRVEGRE